MNYLGIICTGYQIDSLTEGEHVWAITVKFSLGFGTNKDILEGVLALVSADLLAECYVPLNGIDNAFTICVHGKKPDCVRSIIGEYCLFQCSKCEKTVVWEQANPVDGAKILCNSCKGV